MSEENKTIAQRFLKAYDELDWDTWTELAHPDHVFHFPLAPGPLDRDGHLGMNQGFRQAFPKMDHIIESTVAEGDIVALRGTVRVVHEGEFNGIPATGKTIEIGFMDFIRIQDGQNREEWVELDGVKFMVELGAGGGE
jgi:steroid delta-isomerase-like uncharacterized protein